MRLLCQHTRLNGPTSRTSLWHTDAMPGLEDPPKRQQDAGCVRTRRVGLEAGERVRTLGDKLGGGSLGGGRHGPGIVPTRARASVRRASKHCPTTPSACLLPYRTSASVAQTASHTALLLLPASLHGVSGPVAPAPFVPSRLTTRVPAQEELSHLAPRTPILTPCPSRMRTAPPRARRAAYSASSRLRR
jgi:hypothetical protein